MACYDPEPTMRIAQLAPTYERVPPRGYGGTELVVHLVTEELVRRGHDVTLFATGDSVTNARLVSTTSMPHRYGDPDAALRHAEYAHLANVQACFRAAAAGDFDLVHNHAGVEGLVLAAGSGTPVLTTVHNDWVEQTAPIWDAYPWYHHELSMPHALRHPAQGRLAPVHHGIDVADIRPRLDPLAGDGYVIFVGRFSPLKGPDLAVEAALRTGRRLLLVGKVDASDEPWFREHVAPHVDGEQIRLVGEVDHRTRDSLLAAADALVFPIQWDEPFGLVVVEALATGTPVLGFRRGSVPELIEDGRTGFVVDDVDGVVDAMARIPEIDRAACRSSALKKFTVQRMVDDLLARYETVLSSSPTRPIHAPEAIPA